MQQCLHDLLGANFLVPMDQSRFVLHSFQIVASGSLDSPTNLLHKVLKIKIKIEFFQ
jgi:hypothetical protein